MVIFLCASAYGMQTGTPDRGVHGAELEGLGGGVGGQLHGRVQALAQKGSVIRVSCSVVTVLKSLTTSPLNLCFVTEV